MSSTKRGLPILTPFWPLVVPIARPLRFGHPHTASPTGYLSYANFRSSTPDVPPPGTFLYRCLLHVPDEGEPPLAPRPVGTHPRTHVTPTNAPRVSFTTQRRARARVNPPYKLPSPHPVRMPNTSHAHLADPASRIPFQQQHIRVPPRPMPQDPTSPDDTTPTRTHTNRKRLCPTVPHPARRSACPHVPPTAAPTPTACHISQSPRRNTQTLPHKLARARATHPPLEQHNPLPARHAPAHSTTTRPNCRMTPLGNGAPVTPLQSRAIAPKAIRRIPLHRCNTSARNHTRLPPRPTLALALALAQRNPLPATSRGTQALVSSRRYHPLSATLRPSRQRHPLCAARHCPRPR